MSTLGQTLFQHRLLVMIGAFVAALGCAVLSTRLPDVPALLPLSRVIGREVVLAGTGALCLFAFLLRALGELRLGAAVYGQGETAALVDGGVFGRTRNPLYLGNLVFFTALVLLWAPAVVALVLSIAFALALHAMVLHEETLLRASLGAPYAAYLERVPRWLPLGPGGGSATTGGHLGRAIVSNLGLLSFAGFRLGVSLGGPERLLGLVNLLCIAVWAAAVALQRLRALKGSHRPG